MPNHVTNIIEITDGNLTKDRITEILESIKCDDAGIGTIDFNKLIPMPDYIFRDNLGPEEREKYGQNNWYDWSIKNWNTKWNGYHFGKYEGGNSISFQTAWDAPHPVIKALSQKFSGISFTHQWADEDIGVNVGRLDYRNGMVIDEYYPEAQSKEAYEMASDIMGVELSEYGLVLNEDGTEYEYSDDEEMNDDIDGDVLGRGGLSL